MLRRLRLKLGRCNRCLRRGRHELLGDGVLAALLCDKHGYALMEAMAPLAHEIEFELDGGVLIRLRRDLEDEA